MPARVERWAMGKAVCNVELTSSVAVTLSERSKGYNNAWMRDDAQADGVEVPLNLVAVHVVVVDDDNGDAVEGEREVAA